METNDKRVGDFYITLHGIESSQYFQGHGISGNRWEDCATGIGDSEAEALDDALEQLASNGWDVAEVEGDSAARALDKLQDAQENALRRIVHQDCQDSGACDTNDCDAGAESELHYFVSVDVRTRSRRLGSVPGSMTC